MMLQKKQYRKIDSFGNHFGKKHSALVTEFVIVGKNDNTLKQIYLFLLIVANRAK